MSDPTKPEPPDLSGVPPHLRHCLKMPPHVLETWGRAAVKVGLQHADLGYLRAGKEQIALAQRMREPPKPR